MVVITHTHTHTLDLKKVARRAHGADGPQIGGAVVTREDQGNYGPWPWVPRLLYCDPNDPWLNARTNAIGRY